MTKIDITALQQAADDGEAEAQFSLGLFYEQGQGGPNRRSVALVWYLEAAAQGHLGAQNKLGFTYRKDQDYAQNFHNACAIWEIEPAE